MELCSPPPLTTPAPSVAACPLTRQAFQPDAILSVLLSGCTMLSETFCAPVTPIQHTEC